MIESVTLLVNIQTLMVMSAPNRHTVSKTVMFFVPYLKESKNTIERQPKRQDPAALQKEFSLSIIATVAVT